MCPLTLDLDDSNTMYQSRENVESDGRRHLLDSNYVKGPQLHQCLYVKRLISSVQSHTDSPLAFSIATDLFFAVLIPV
jgi:hypothetical protein